MLLKENVMLKNKSSSAIVAVRDLDRARSFYVETLGLDALPGAEEDVLTLSTGDTRLIVYKSDAAGTNKANAAVWDVGVDFDTIADQLKEQGVTFEEYPEMGLEISGGVHSSGDFRAAWFKDPDGNILHINNM